MMISFPKFAERFGKIAAGHDRITATLLRHRDDKLISPAITSWAACRA
jgi:hypothetical protein